MPHPQPGSAPPDSTPRADGGPRAEPAGTAGTGRAGSDEDLPAPGDQDAEDTLNLELPQEWPELLAQREAYDQAQDRLRGQAQPRSSAHAAHEVQGLPGHPGQDEASEQVAVARSRASRSACVPPAPGELLDGPADWPAAATEAGPFQLVPVCLPRDVPLVSAWMNDPAVAAFWELSGPEQVTEAHLRPQLEGDGRSVPCLGLLDGTPMSYWELYRADLDPLARYCRTRPHDTGVHLLIGGVAHRGRGLGTTLLRAVADLVLDHRPRCTRVLAEPDIRNDPSVAAFLGAGFRFSAEIQLPTKRAALMVRDRALRHVL